MVSIIYRVQLIVVIELNCTHKGSTFLKMSVYVCTSAGVPNVLKVGVSIQNNQTTFYFAISTHKLFNLLLNAKILTFPNHFKMQIKWWLKSDRTSESSWLSFLRFVIWVCVQSLLWSTWLILFNAKNYRKIQQTRKKTNNHTPKTQINRVTSL